jgi:hypothetical protein
VRKQYKGQWRSKMTHKAIGVEVRRRRYDIVVDGQRAGSIEMNQTIELQVEPGRHVLQVRSGRKSSRTQTLDAAKSQTIVPSLALHLRGEADDRSL